jgi:tetratricopeptide (TPR) repeat protein
LQKKKYPKWFYVILVLFPFLILFLLELFLRLFNYGINLDQWVPINDKQIVLNPEIAQRYFSSSEGMPYPPSDPIDIKKDSNAIRIFVVGGSSAAGFPYGPNGTIAKYLKKRFEISKPKNKIEVVNAAMAAVNSYTIRDIIPGIIDQDPDVIIIYAGHNEYYGALGVGSAESLGRSRVIVNFLISLNSFKTFQLLRNLIKYAAGIFVDNSPMTGTLMKRMAQEKLIPLDSEIYNKGIEQFENNIADVVSYCRSAEIPLVICTISSNLKDQKPFISIKDSRNPTADEIYEGAQKELTINPQLAFSLFLRAKELDALRFRAPEKINEIIYSYKNFNSVTIVDIDSLFRSKSTYGIVGNNLMTDHLHPTLEGYLLIGKEIFKALNRDVEDESTSEKNDSLIKAIFPFSKLDSTIAEFRIKRLINDWPYVQDSSPNNNLTNIFSLKTIIDSLAYQIVFRNHSWEQAHRRAAKHYLDRGNIESYLFEYEILIDQFPQIKTYYKIISYDLVNNQLFKEALPYLEKYYKNEPDYYSAKWLGIIYLSKKNLDQSIKYLSESINYKSDDPQVHYNLAGAYLLSKDFDKAYRAINNCINLEPNYLGASQLKDQIARLIKIGKE